jgi:L-xylulokinase
VKRYLLGIDNGLTNSKAILFDIDGHELAVARRSFEVASPHVGWAEASPEILWENTADCILEVLKKTKISSAEIGGVGCCGFGTGAFFVGKGGRSSYPAIGSTDNRAVEIALKLSRSTKCKKIMKINNTPMFAFQTAIIARWLKENEPDAYENTDWICACKDYINFRLTGTKTQERNDVSGAAYLDMQTKEYSQELFDLFGVPEMMRKVAPLAESSNTIIGNVSKEAAKRTGLTEGTPVCAGMMDVAACAIGCGVVDERYACAIVGTWGINEIVTDRFFNNATSTQVFAVGGKILTLNGGATSAGNLEWFAQQFGPMFKSKAEGKNKSIYDYLTGEASKIEPGATNVLYLPYIGTPNVHPYGRAMFSNIHSSNTVTELIHALFEGITFEHKRNFDLFFEQGAKIPVLRLAGGGARSAFWSQMFADVLNVPVQIVEVTEMGGMGACVAAGVGAGIFKDYDDAFDHMIDSSKAFEPIPGNNAKYMERYQSWLATVKGMCEVWNIGRISLQ